MRSFQCNNRLFRPLVASSATYLLPRPNRALPVFFFRYLTRSGDVARRGLRMRVFVTGATRGIGRAIAESISARGGEHVLFLGCRDTQRAAALAATLSCGSVQVVPVEIDVTKSATIAAAASAVAAACSASSPLDALVNNAGVLLERDGCDLASIVEPTLSVNVAGVIAVTESFLPLLREGGRVINVSSGAGTRATASLDDAERASLEAATDVHSLRAAILRLAQAAAALPREPGDTPIYGLSKAGVNFYTRLVARQARAAWLGHRPGSGQAAPLTYSGPRAHAQRASGPRSSALAAWAPQYSPRACPRRGQTRWQVVVCACCPRHLRRHGT